jgi:oligoendopeptidase F
VQQFMAGLQNRTLFFSLWWKSLEDAEAERLMKDSGEFRYWLEEMRHYKPYTLTELEEKIINIKDVTGVSAMQRLYDSLTNRYVFKVTVDGEEKELTRGELMALVYGTDPDLRAAAYQELYRIYAEDGPILGQMYQAVVQDWRNEKVDLRGYTSPISARNMANDIPDEVVDTLLDVAEKNAGLFQRFFKLKAKLLGVNKLRRYDIYAPVAGSNKEYSFDEAAHMVQEAFADFDPKIAELAQRLYDQNHIDSEVRKGKRGGAFCSSGDPALAPYVLVNYNKQARDVSTLAHELGHAIHALLAEDKTVFTYHATLPLAETASTFGEMLFIDHLLERETDEDVRRDILFAQVDDNYATIMRQIFFALFEREAHEMVNNGAPVKELADAYVKNLEKQFGDALEIGEEFRWEWVSIPHIYQVPFYVYAYAFGQLLVLALYQQYKAEGDAFKPRYIEILSAGGSMSPEEILTKAGIDMRSADFWQGGFDVLEGMISELEKMTV